MAFEREDIVTSASRLNIRLPKNLGDVVYSLFEFERAGEDISVVSEKHYQLVPPDGVTVEDLAAYRQRLSDVVT